VAEEVTGLQVLAQVERHANDLLPNHRMQLEVQRVLRSGSVGEESSEELEHLELSLTACLVVQDEVVLEKTITDGLVLCWLKQRQHFTLKLSADSVKGVSERSACIDSCLALQSDAAKTRVLRGHENVVIAFALFFYAVLI